MTRPQELPFHGGKWAVERERNRISEPTPPLPFTEAKTMDALLPQILKRIGAEMEPWLSALEREWPTLVGESVAAHTRPGRIVDGTLIIYVDHSIWLQELSRGGKTLIMNKLRQRFGQTRVRDLLLRIDQKPLRA